MDPKIAYLQDQLAGAGERLDEGETMVLERQLRVVKNRVMSIEYSTLRAREFVPISTELPEAAESYVYRMWDEAGMAKIISDYADDLPLVDAHVTETVKPIVTVGDGYMYSVMDLKRAALVPDAQLPTRKARAARNFIERKFDEIIALGDTMTGLEGFLNNSNVPLVTLPYGDWTDAARTPDEILADLFAMEQAIIDNTLEHHEADTLILPPSRYGLITSTARTAQSDTTILKHFLASAQSIRNVGKWGKLETAGASSATRMVAYKRSPDVVEAELPLEYEELPPERRNLAFLVNAFGRIGGTIWYRPLAGAYADGI